MTAASTKHGTLTAPKRAERRYVRTLINRNRLRCDAYLPPEMAARLGEYLDKLATPQPALFHPARRNAIHRENPGIM